MLKFIAGLLGYGLIKPVIKISGEVEESEEKRKTITNASLQEKTRAAYQNIYLRRLSIVDPEIETFPTEGKRSLFDVIEELYKEAGIEFGLKREDFNVDKCFESYWRTYGYSFSQAEYAAKLDDSKEMTLHDRISMSLSPYNKTVNALIYNETKRSMWKKGYNMSYGGKESIWQEKIKAEQEEKLKKANSPWL